MRIQNNVPALNAHRFYTINNNGMTKSVAKLSSGYRINSAADDAAGLAISEKMRAQIRGLTMASKNAQDATSLVQTAEGGLQEIDNMLQRIRELVDYASNDTMEHNAYMTGDRQKVQDEINQLTQEIDSMADRVEFNKKKLLNGDLAGMPTAGAATLNATINSAKDSLKTQQNAYSAALQDFKNATNGAQAARDVFNTTITDTNITEYLKKISETGGTSVAAHVETVQGALSALKNNTGLANTYDKVSDLNTQVTAVETAMQALKTAVDAIDPSVTANAVQSKEQARAAYSNLEKLLGSTTSAGTSALRSAYEGSAESSPLGQAKAAIKKYITDLSSAANALGGITASGSMDNDVKTAVGADVLETALGVFATAVGTAKTALDALVSAVDSAQTVGALQTAATALVAGLTTYNSAITTARSTLDTAKTTFDTTSSGKDLFAEMPAALSSGMTWTGWSDVEGDTTNTSEATAALAWKSAQEGHVSAFAASVANGLAAVSTAAVVPADSITGAVGDLVTAAGPYATANKVAGGANNVRVSDLSQVTSGLVNRYRSYNASNVALTGALGDLNSAKSDFAIAQQDLAAAPKTGGLFFQVGANANQGMQLYINSIKTDKLGIGDGNGVSMINVLDSTGMNITAQLDTLDTALSYVTTERAKLGAAQNRLEYTMNSLDISAENLTAAESRIRDVDMAKEMSNFTRQNILFQASTAMLAQANSMPQGVLQLLG